MLINWSLCIAEAGKSSAWIKGECLINFIWCYPILNLKLNKLRQALLSKNKVPLFELIT